MYMYVCIKICIHTYIYINLSDTRRSQSPALVKARAILEEERLPSRAQTSFYSKGFPSIAGVLFYNNGFMSIVMAFLLW